MFMNLTLLIGKAHTSYNGLEVTERTQMLVECRCHCAAKFSAEELQSILQSFNDLPTHEAQNIYLRGCVNVVPETSIRRRPRNEDAVERKSYTFTITLPRKTEKVCKAAFMGVHGIKESRMKKKVFNFDVSIADGRGKHDNHPKLDDTVRRAIREHIKKFPARESHYSRSSNAKKVYLDADFTVAKMHRQFIEEHTAHKDVKYWVYNDIFNYEFNISFGYPRSDICDTCEKLTTQLKAAEATSDHTKAAELKRQHELHVRKADVFNTQIAEATEAAKLSGDTDVIAMDYEKNLPLPLTGVGQEYYKRQLWLHNLCIHSTVENQATMYVYAEHYAGKGANEVISCLDHYITQLPPTVTKLIVFVDNCFSQNKNRFVFFGWSIQGYTCFVPRVRFQKY